MLNNDPKIVLNKPSSAEISNIARPNTYPKMKPQNAPMRVMVSCAFVFTLAVMVMWIQHTKQEMAERNQLLRASIPPIHKQILISQN
jgi:hypothetical protein